MRVLGVVLMAMGLLSDPVVAKPKQPAIPQEVQQFVAAREAGKINDQQWLEGRAHIFNKYGLTVVDTKNEQHLMPQPDPATGLSIPFDDVGPAPKVR